jgi:hypothetical protein
MIDVVVVGFGFSAVPLIRQLELSGTNYQVVSGEDNSVWDRLGRAGRLDFDLVSSYLTSFFSFDLAESFDNDFYPLATQFYQMHQKWRKIYGGRVIRDQVTRVDNFEDHSVIHTRGGEAIEARHVVFATGFGRAILSDLAEIDYNAPHQTFVFDTMGDSANLMISHLIPHDAKIIIRTNGFHPRDKVVPAFETTHTLDQLEFHNYRYVSHDLYASIVYGATAGSGSPFLIGDQFPVTARDESWNTSRSRPVSGTVAIKYWPIDEYSRMFGANLTGAISKGYLLNDIAMWLHTGRAIVVPKDTPIDHLKKTITYGGVERTFHHYVKSDVETPRLPPVMIGGVTPYQHLHRDCFMGVIPKTLHNVYLMGYTRPYTGGLANIIEMQGLLVHKLVTQPSFHQRIHRNLAERIAAYNTHYYGESSFRRYDHLVYYGFYTDDMARLIGIEHRPSDCSTVRDLLFYYAFPNNTFKYRLTGEYAVNGVGDLVDKINRQFRSFIVSFAFLMSCSHKDAATRPEWLHSVRRHFFNDMRHKERYRPFLANYIRAYRRLKGVRIAEQEDREWESMVAAACQDRERILTGISEPSVYQMDEDMGNEIKLIESWLDGGPGSDEIRKLKLDRQHAARLDLLMDPPEYKLAFLQ